MDILRFQHSPRPKSFSKSSLFSSPPRHLQVSDGAFPQLLKLSADARALGCSNHPQFAPLVDINQRFRALWRDNTRKLMDAYFVNKHVVAGAGIGVDETARIALKNLIEKSVEPMKEYLVFCLKNCRELPMFQNITESLEREGICLLQGFLKRLSARAIEVHFGNPYSNPYAAQYSQNRTSFSGAEGASYWQRLSTPQWLAYLHGIDVELAASPQLNKLLPGERVAWKVLVDHSTAKLTCQKEMKQGGFRYEFDAISNNVRASGAPSNMVIAYATLFEKIDKDRQAYAAAKTQGRRRWNPMDLRMGGGIFKQDQGGVRGIAGSLIADQISTTDGSGDDPFAGVGQGGPSPGGHFRGGMAGSAGKRKSAEAEDIDGMVIGGSGKRMKV